MTTTDRPHGMCPVCRRPFALTKHGRLWRHGDGRNVWPPANCAGWGREPVTTTTEGTTR